MVKWDERSEHTVCKDMVVTVSAQRFRVNGGHWNKAGEPWSFKKGDRVECDYGPNPYNH